MKLWQLIKEAYDPLENVSVIVHIPLDQSDFIKNGKLPSPEKITLDLYQNNPPPGITPINIKVLRTQFLKGKEAKIYAFKNQELGLLSPAGFKPYGKNKKPLIGIDRYNLDGLLIAVIVVDLRDLMTQDVNYGVSVSDILKKLKRCGVSKRVFEVAKEWLIDNYESIPQARIGRAPNSKVNVDQWPAPKLSRQDIKKTKEINPPDFDLEWD